MDVVIIGANSISMLFFKFRGLWTLFETLLNEVATFGMRQRYYANTHSGFGRAACTEAFLFHSSCNTFVLNDLLSLFLVLI